MKPKELKSPFSFEERRVLLLDRVLFVPEYYDAWHTFQLPPFHDPLLFGNTHPVKIEYCSGNGTWIAEKARENPSINFIAVEKDFERARKIWSKIKNYALSNLIVVAGEALSTTRHYIPSHSLEEVYVNFPDPWPKRRHFKHRLITPLFAEEVARVLKEQGVATLVTDDPDYSALMIEAFHQSGFRSLYPDPWYTPHLEGYGTSFFETLWREKGRVIRYHQFQNG